MESISSFFSHRHNMEEDRRQTDLGTAADIEEAQLAQTSQSPAFQNEPETAAPLKQPKKRFIGRRAAVEAAAVLGASGESGAVQSM